MVSRVRVCPAVPGAPGFNPCLDVFMRDKIATFRRCNALFDRCDLPFLDRKELLDRLSEPSGKCSLPWEPLTVPIWSYGSI
jgi:hypothetical protein